MRLLGELPVTQPYIFYSSTVPLKHSCLHKGLMSKDDILQANEKLSPPNPLLGPLLWCRVLTRPPALRPVDGSRATGCYIISSPNLLNYYHSSSVLKTHWSLPRSNSTHSAISHSYIFLYLVLNSSLKFSKFIAGVFPGQARQRMASDV